MYMYKYIYIYIYTCIYICNTCTYVYIGGVSVVLNDPFVESEDIVDLGKVNGKERLANVSSYIAVLSTRTERSCRR